MATPQKIEIAVDVIVHATEDIERILSALEEALGVRRDDIGTQTTTGHYDNPITILSARVTKDRAREVLKRIRAGLSEEQTDELVGEISERVADSRLYVRFGKQEMVREGSLVFVQRDDPVRVRIHTPVYNKRETVRTFTEIITQSEPIK